MRYIEIHTARGCFHVPYDSCTDVVIGLARAARPFVEPPPPAPIEKPTLADLFQTYQDINAGPYSTFRLTGEDLAEADKTISEAEKGVPVDWRKIDDLFCFLRRVVLQDGRVFEGLTRDDIEAKSAEFGLEFIGYWFGADTRKPMLTPEQGKCIAWYLKKVFEIANIKDLPTMDPVKLIEDFLEIEQDRQRPTFAEQLFSGSRK